MRMTADMTIGPRPAAAHADRLAPIAARIGRVFAGIAAHAAARRAERRMLLLSDEALRDIGVSRAELEARNPGAPPHGRMRPDI